MHTTYVPASCLRDTCSAILLLCLGSYQVMQAYRPLSPCEEESVFIADHLRQAGGPKRTEKGEQSCPSSASQSFTCTLLIVLQVSSQSHRFKVVSKHRCLNDSEIQDETKSDPTAR